MDLLPYENPPAKTSNLDTTLGWLTAVGIAGFLGLGIAMGGLADMADEHPLAANIAGCLLVLIFLTHLILVAIRLRHAWRCRDLPTSLGFAAVVDGLVLITFVIGLLIDEH